MVAIQTEQVPSLILCIKRRKRKEKKKRKKTGVYSANSRRLIRKRPIYIRYKRPTAPYSLCPTLHVSPLFIKSKHEIQATD